MHRIDGPGATAQNLFTEGNPTTGVQATVVTADWANAVQEEIATVIEGYGLTLNKAANNQLFLAIQSAIESVSGGSGGEANTASNVGTGAGLLFKQKSAADLQFRTLRAGTGIAITTGTNEVTITATGGGGTIEATYASNVGTGTGVFRQMSGYELQFRTLKAGPGVQISSTDTEITITATGGGTSGGAVWGSISGSLSNQQDLAGALSGKANAVHGHSIADVNNLQQALDAKANLSGATFTGPINFPTSNTTSALRYKKQIEALDERDALAMVQSLGVVRYALRSDGTRHIGVIAEQLMNGPADFVVQRNENGEAEAVDYNSLFTAALRVVQSLAERVQALEQRLGGA
ncbi:MAG: tail fiber domain-containing protein [Pseudomonadota bacterium]